MFEESELIGMYELARLYYEMGYLSAAERILNGLVQIDDGLTPSRGALGVVKLEAGKPDEAVQVFRAAVKSPRRGEDIIIGKLGLVASFLSAGDLERATTLIQEIEIDLADNPADMRDLRELWAAFAIRCGVRGIG